MRGTHHSIETLQDSVSICTFRCGEYWVQLQKCDTDRIMHGGLNIIAQTGEIVPLFESCSGMDVFLLQNTSGKIIGEHEIGWRILAQNLGVALEYIAAAKPNRTPPYIGMPKSDEE